MKRHFAALLALALPFVYAQAQTASAQRQNLPALRAVVEQYLQTQSAGLPGQVSVKVGAVDQRMSLPHCPAPEAFQQPAARPWGKTTVGVRCTAPTAWTVYIQAQVSVLADYLVSHGANFSVSAEAKAIGTAGEGQVVQVRTQSGTVVSGTARMGGLVEVVL